MPSKSKTDFCAYRSILALPSAYQEGLVTFKLMTSQLAQGAQPLGDHMWRLRFQRVNLIANVQKSTTMIAGNCDFISKKSGLHAMLECMHASLACMHHIDEARFSVKLISQTFRCYFPVHT